MAALDASNRARVLAQAMRDLPTALRPWPAVTKADLAAAIAATDTWIDDNASGFNSALPTTARTALSAQQKTFLFCYVALRRAGLLKAEED